MRYLGKKRRVLGLPAVGMCFRIFCMGLVIYFTGLPRSFGAVDEGPEPVSFTSWLLPDPTSMSVSDQAERAVVREFLRLNPTIHIEAFQMPAIQGSGMDTGPLMGIASGNPPHAMYVNFRQSSTYINHGFLVPIEEILARLESTNELTRASGADGNWLAAPTAEEIAAAKQKIKERVANPVWPVIHRRALIKKVGIPQGDHVWALPVGTLVKALSYRKDVFKEAGLDPERPPEDWDELMAYSRKIKQIPGKYGFAFFGGPSVSYSVYSFLVSNGARYMSRNADGEWQAAFASREAAEAIHYILRLVNEPFEVDGQTYYGTAFMPTSSASLNRYWAEGRIGMMFTYLDQEMLANINPEMVGLAPIPKSSRGTFGSELNCRMLGIYSGSTPAQQLAIMKYGWFITGTDAQRIRTRIYVENGFGRFVNPVLLKQFGYTDVLKQVPKGWQETFETALENGVPEPYGKGTQFIYQKVSEPINWALGQPLLSFPKEEALDRIEEQLQETAARVDRFTLGKLTPKEWRTRRTIGGAALLVTILIFAGTLRWVWKAFGEQEKLQGDRPPSHRFIKAYILILPALLVVLLWQYLPVVLGAPLALFDYELAIQSVFVGIDNFATVLYDERFWQSLGRTWYYVLLVVGLGFWPPILIAILLDEVPTVTLKYFFRTMYYLPAIVSGIILVFLWRQLFEPSESGILNQFLLSLNKLGPIQATLIKWIALGIWFSLIGFLMSVTLKLGELSMAIRTVVMIFALSLLGATLWPLVKAFVGPTELEIAALGLNAEAVRGWSGVGSSLSSLVGRFEIEPLGWLTDPGLAMICVVIPSVWAHAGPGCIIYLAALKTVPEDLIEAASIDGAGVIQKLCYITLPSIKFLILIQLIGALVGAFKGGTNFILALTGGGPNGATRVLGMDIFERSFMELNYGQGAAMAWILGAIVMVVTANQLRRMSRAEFKTQDSKKEA